MSGIYKMNNLSIVLTSCGRLDLLQQTVKSIHPDILKNTKINILIDDSGNKDIHSKIESNPLFSNWKKIYNEENIGQPKSVDKAYSFVDTDYIFHCEDDWVFDHTTQFVTDSLQILEKHPEILQVTFRKDDPHELKDTPFNFKLKVPGWGNEWFGFTYNPSILRTSSVRKVLPYSGKNEQSIGLLYNQLGLFTVAIGGVVEHIGWGRSTNSHIKL